MSTISADTLTTANGAISHDVQHLGGVGTGQTWQNFNGSRSAGVAYQNTTGKPIMVNVQLQSTSTLRGLQWGTDGTTWLSIALVQWNEIQHTVSAIIPDGHYYRLSSGGISNWWELRD